MDTLWLEWNTLESAIAYVDELRVEAWIRADRLYQDNYLSKTGQNASIDDCNMACNGK